jgi:hypothetical protein
MERSSKKDLIVTLSVLLAIVFIVTGVIITKKQPSAVGPSTATIPADSAPTTTTEVASSPKPVDTTASPSQTTSAFKDGAYTASGRYATPENTETITINVTLKDGVITDTSATASTRSRDSKEYVSMFIENYKNQVVGKKISELKLGRVSGSSLTPQGFNVALDSIITQAKA